MLLKSTPSRRSMAPELNKTAPPRSKWRLGTYLSDQLKRDVAASTPHRKCLLEPPDTKVTNVVAVTMPLLASSASHTEQTKKRRGPTDFPQLTTNTLAVAWQDLLPSIRMQTLHQNLMQRLLSLRRRPTASLQPCLVASLQPSGKIEDMLLASLKAGLRRLVR